MCVCVCVWEGVEERVEVRCKYLQSFTTAVCIYMYMYIYGVNLPVMKVT